MPTLSELAKTQQSTSVSGASGGAVGSVGGTNIQATEQVDNSAALTKDIGKMFGGVMKEHQQASEYAGARVGTDNLVNYKSDMEKVARRYADKKDVTSSDMVAKNREEHGLYESYMQKGHFGDNALANEAFKDTYSSPAYDHLLRSETQNNTKKVLLFQGETKRDISFAISYLGTDLNKEVVETFTTQYRNAGLDPQLIWDKVAIGLNSAYSNKFKDGLSSPSLVPYLEQGALTQDSLDNLFNDTYGKFATRTNGVFKKVDKSIPDSAYEMMKKSYSGWLSSFNKQDKKGKTKVDILSPSIISGLRSDMPIDVLKNAEKNFKLEYIQVSAACALNGNDSDACSKLPKLRDAGNVLATKIEENFQLDTSFKRFNSSADNDISSLNTDTTISVSVKSYSKGIPDGLKSSMVDAEQKQEYVQKRYSSMLTSLLTSKELDLDGSNGLAKKIAALFTSNMTGGSTTSASNTMKSVSNMASLNGANTTGQLLNNLQFAVSYKEATGVGSYDGLSRQTLGSVLSYYGALVERQKEDPETYTEAKILGLIRIMSSAQINSNSKMAFEGTRDVLKELGLDGDGDEGDELLKGSYLWYTHGTGIFSEGSLDIALKYIKNDGMSYPNVGQVKSAVKAKMLVLDPDAVPMWGTSLAVTKPTQLGDKSDDEWRDNFNDLVKYKLYKNVELLNVKFEDIVDEGVGGTSTIQVKQVDDTQGLQTIVEFIKGGRVTSYAIIDDDEWALGVTAKQKAATDRYYEKTLKLKDNLFGTHGGKKSAIKDFIKKGVR